MELTVDVTDRIEVYRKGKTLDCDCGHGIGVGMSRKVMRCYSCGRTLVDHDAENRSFEPDGDGQTTFDEWT